MGDLTRALVDLATAAERRRAARSDLRVAIPTIVEALLDQLRAGDAIDIYPTDGSDPVIYAVERVSWYGSGVVPPEVDRTPRDFDRTYPIDVREQHPHGAPTLIRWPTPKAGRVDGAVLLDPRASWAHDGRDDMGYPYRVELEPDRGPNALFVRDLEDTEFYDPTIHLASDDELVLFASEAHQIISGFAERFADDADVMRGAVTSTSKLGPR